ncbi:MAG: FUSC family protein [Candidatus Xenobiia bacterium LiM19]
MANGNDRAGKDLFFPEECLAGQLRDTLRIKWAAKAAVACLVAELVACHFRLSMGYWTVITVFLLFQLSTNATLRKGLLRIAGTIAGCGYGYLILSLSHDNIPFILLMLIPWIIVTLYFFFKGYYPYCFFVACLTAVILACNDIAGVSKTEILVMGRFLDIMLGIIITGVVAGLLWRTSDLRELRDNSGRLLRQTLLFALAVANDIPPTLLRKEGAHIVQLLKRQDFLISSCDFSTIPYNPAYFRELRIHSKHLYSRSLHAGHTLMKSPESPALSSLFTHSGSDTGESGEAFQKLSDNILGIKNVEGEKVLSLVTSREFFPQEDILTEGILRKILGDESQADDSILIKAGLFIHIFEMLKMLPTLPSDEPASSQCTKSREAAHAVRKAGHLKVDKDALAASVKTTVSTILSMACWLIPFHNVQATLTAFFLTITKIHTSTSRKFVFRITGTLAGGVIAFVFIALFGSVPYLLIGPISLLLALFIFINMADEDWNYVGFTGGITFIFCVGAFFLAKASLTEAIHRMEGVIMGGITGITVSILIFPPRHMKRIEAVSRELLEIYRKALHLFLSSLTGSVSPGPDISNIDTNLRNKTLEYQNVVTDMAWDPFLGGSSKKAFMERCSTVFDISRCICTLLHIIPYIQHKTVSAAAKSFVEEVLPSLEKMFSHSKETPEIIESEYSNSVMAAAESCSSLLAGEIRRALETRASKKELHYCFFLKLFLIEITAMLKKLTTHRQ